MTDFDDEWLLDAVEQWEAATRAGVVFDTLQAVGGDPERSHALRQRIDSVLRLQKFLPPSDFAGAQVLKPDAAELLRQLTSTGIISTTDALAADTPAAREWEEKDVLDTLQGKHILTPWQADAIRGGKLATLILDEYVLLTPLGKGAMGEVFHARHRLLDRHVAIKRMPVEASQNAAAVQRFQRELRALAKLHHPNVVTAHDAGTHEGRLYLVMEFVPGIDLSKYVRDHGPRPWAEACSLICQAAAGLQAAHDLGFVHRDVKPANLMRCFNGTVKMLDLGLATGRGEPDRDGALTDVHSVLGTADYMAPEQAENIRAASESSDIYSLGCTLYFLLTGRPPYSGSTLTERLVAHRNQSIPELPKTIPGVTDALRELISDMLSKAPARRPRSMNEVIGRLDRILEQFGEPKPSAIIVPERADRLAAPGQPQRRIRRRSRFLGTAALCLPVMIVIWILATRPSSQATSSIGTNPSRIRPGLGASAPPSADLPRSTRSIAAKMISLGGAVELQMTTGDVVTLSALPLPPEDFEIAGISFADNQQLRDGDLDVLARLPSLRNLSLRACHNLTEQCVNAIRSVDTLVVLGLEEMHLADDAIAKLGELKRLQFVSVVNSLAGDKSVAAFLTCPMLDTLYVGGCPKVTRHAFLEGASDSLQLVDVGNTNVRYEDLSQILDHCPNLKFLKFGLLRGDSHAAAIAISERNDFGQLEFSPDDFSDEDVRFLLSVRGLRSLALLKATRLDQVFQSLLEFPAISELWLRLCSSSTTALEAVCKNKNLSRLSIDGWAIEDADLLRLSEMENLQSLELTLTHVTEEGVSEFQKLRPDVTCDVELQ